MREKDDNDNNNNSSGCRAQPNKGANNDNNDNGTKRCSSIRQLAPVLGYYAPALLHLTRSGFRFAAAAPLLRLSASASPSQPISESNLHARARQRQPASQPEARE